MGLDEPSLVPGGVDLAVSRPTPAIAAQTAATRELTDAEKLATATRMQALLELRTMQEAVNKRGQQLWIETRTEAKRYTMQIQELNRLYREEGVISLDTYNRGLDRIRVPQQCGAIDQVFHVLRDHEIDPSVTHMEDALTDSPPGLLRHQSTTFAVVMTIGSAGTSR